MKYYLKLLSVPLLFLIIYTSLALVWNLFSLPAPDELANIVGVWFDKFGIPALFFSSILEGMLLIGSYFPGVFVIFLGVVVADSPNEAILSLAVCTFGLITAHILNYFLGKHGWYRLLVRFGMKEAVEQSRARLEKRGPLAIPLSYWLPSVGALTNTAAGIIGMPVKKFLLYSVSSSLFWYSLVGFLVYRAGDRALEVAGGGAGNIYVFSIIVIWIAILVVIDYFERKEAKYSPDRN